MLFQLDGRKWIKKEENVYYFSKEKARLLSSGNCLKIRADKFSFPNCLTWLVPPASLSVSPIFHRKFAIFWRINFILKNYFSLFFPLSMSLFSDLSKSILLYCFSWSSVKDKLCKHHRRQSCFLIFFFIVYFQSNNDSKTSKIVQHYTTDIPQFRAL